MRVSINSRGREQGLCRQKRYRTGPRKTILTAEIENRAYDGLY